MLARTRVDEIAIPFALGIAIACSFDSSSLTTGGAVSVGEGDVGSTAANDDDPSTLESDDASGDAASHDESSTGSPSCDICAAAPPAEWSGPFAIGPVAPTDPNPACPSGWTRSALGYRDLQAADATCGCDCAAIPGQCNATASYCSDSSCSILVTQGSSTGECQSLITLAGYDYVTASATAEGHGCTAVPSETIPPASWSDGMMLCAPPPGAACDAGTCLPEIPDVLDGRWCVTKPGEQACPPGEYSEALVAWQGLTDARDCTRLRVRAHPTPARCHLPCCGLARRRRLGRELRRHPAIVHVRQQRLDTDRCCDTRRRSDVLLRAVIRLRAR